MATKLNKVEQEVFNNLKETETFKAHLNWWCTTACLSGKTAAEQRKETLDYLRKCARIIVRNPNIEPHKIYGWWFGCTGYRKPRNIVLA